jgi:micrococcal nuclease
VSGRGIAAIAAVAAAAAVAAGSGSGATAPRVWYVVDGDTIRLTDQKYVRLLQIDTPEPGTGECYSRAAGRALRRLLPDGSAVGLERDPALDDRDRFGRLLRYVWRGRVNLNVQLVREGAATVWLYDHERGKYADRLLREAQAARRAGRGLWGACDTVWDPYGPATTHHKGSASGAGTGRGGCDPSYPTVCIPPPPPDLDCKDVPYTNFVVRPPDAHRFDGNGDGRGCEG